MTQGEFKMDFNTTTLMPKGDLDHSELDESYFIKRLKNDAKMIEQKEELREAKASLREFENDMDNQMPVSQKLQDFKKMA